MTIDAPRHPLPTKRRLSADGLWLAGIFLAALLTFQPALYNTPICDDHPQTQEIAVPAGLAGWGHAALAPWWPPTHHKNIWRPVTRLSILVQKVLTDPAVWPLYGVNVLLHGAVCTLLFLLARRLGWGPSAAGLGALLFAVHPIHAEAVHAVVGRAETLAALWMLAGLLLYLRWGAGDWRGWLAQPLLFALALGSKEHAMLYPCLLALAMLTPSAAPSLPVPQFPRLHSAFHIPHSAFPLLRPSRSALFMLALLALLALVLGLFLGAKAWVTGGVIEPPSTVPYHENPLAGMALSQRLPAALGIFGYAASRLVWPLGLAPDYSAFSLPFERGWRWGWCWAGLGLLVVILVLSVRDARRGRRGWALAVAALGSYTLISNGPFVFGTVMAQRLWYWPSAAACLGLGWLLAGRYGRLAPARRRMGTLLLTAGVLALIATAWGDAPAWRSLEGHARATLACFPRSWRAQTDLASACCQAGNYEEGYRHAREAVRLMPRQVSGWRWLGYNAIHLPGRRAEAEQAFAQALALDPEPVVYAPQ